MILIKNALFKYPESSFKVNISDIDIKQAEQVCINGPSGSGKSTFLKMLSGELKSTSSEFQVLETSLNNLNKKKMLEFRLNSIGIIFQTSNLFNWLSVEDNILLPFSVMNTKLDKEVLQRYEKLAQVAGISSLRKKCPNELSVGELQRVAIVRALLPKHRLLLADEPTASLDHRNADLISDLILSECKEHDTTLIYVSHSSEEQQKFSSHLDSSNWVSQC